MGGIIVNETGPDWVAGGGQIFNQPGFPGVVMNPIRNANVAGLERSPQDRPISLREVCEDDRGQMIREWLCDWDQRDQAKKQLLGYPYVSPLNGTRYIQRFLPDYVPWLLTDNNGFEPPGPYLWCTSLPNIEPDGSPPPDGLPNAPWVGNWGEPRYGNAFITALYTTPTYELLSDAQMVQMGYTDSNGNPDESTLKRYVTLQANPQQKYQTIPTGTFVFAGTGGPYNNSPGRVELEADLSITWHRIPRAAIPFKFLNYHLATNAGGSPYVSAIENCMGSVNLYPFAGSLKGTLLFTAAVFKPIKSPIGMRLWDIEYRFKYFNAKSATSLTTGGVTGYSHGHNLVLYYGPPGQTPPFANPGYQEIVSGTGGVTTSNYLLANPADYNNLFNYRDFTTLFQVPQLKYDPGNN